MTDKKNALEKLEQQQKELAAQIREAKKAIKEEEQKAKEAKAVHIGLAVLAEMEENQTLARQIKEVLERRVTASKARTVLGLDALTKTEKPTAIAAE